MFNWLYTIPTWWSVFFIPLLGNTHLILRVFLAFLRHVIGHVRCSHFHINILVFFVGLSFIVLCYLCDFFSWLCHVLLHVFTIMIILFKHHRFTFSKEMFLYTLKGIVFRIDVIFDWSEKRCFFDFCKSPIFRKFTK
jgi:hypothetical protein